MVGLLDSMERREMAIVDRLMRKSWEIRGWPSARLQGRGGRQAGRQAYANAGARSGCAG